MELNLLWKPLAYILSRPAMVDWLISRSEKTPYTPIYGPDGSIYMDRYWLFNPYPPSSPQSRANNWFPISIRLHHIIRPDSDRHLHDHPWNARTIILRGAYVEERYDNIFCRRPGDTARLNFGEYHRIKEVSLGGVWTLFITGKYRGTWGFKVNGVKVPWRTYFGIE